MSVQAWTQPQLPQQPQTDSAECARFEGGWLVMSRPALPRREDDSHCDFGTPGLWRTLPDAAGEHARVFEIPPRLRADDAPDAPADPADPAERDWEADPVAMARVQDLAATPGARPHHLGLLLWALVTESGAPLEDAPPPTPDDLAAWAPPAARRVRAGAHVSQVEILAKPERVALAIPSLVRLPPELPLARALWLGELCRDAMQKWRLVRFGIDTERHCVRAEVDLTGAPSAYLPALFGLALAALTSSAAWALPGLALAADPSVESRLLEHPPRRSRRPGQTIWKQL